MDGHNQFFPFLGTTNMLSESQTKLSHDRYEVYVNGDFVGFKSLLTQNETLDDVNDFLYEQGYQNFNAESFGDHYDIQTDGSDEKLKQALQVYLQTR